MLWVSFRLWRLFRVGKEKELHVVRVLRELGEALELKVVIGCC